MAEISAKTVNELRNKTGLGMMECKKLLGESGGNVEEAIRIARGRGVNPKITERISSEGRVFAAKSADGKTASLIEVNCNTDFSAKSEPVANLGKKAAEALAANPNSDPKQVVASELVAVAQQTGENVNIGKTATVSSGNGKVAHYTYGITGKIGVAMAFEGNVANLSDELVMDIGGHIAFARPAGLDRNSIDPALVAKEREIAVEQAKATGKPQNIAEKIAEGKLNSFFAEKALLDQEFFNSAKYKGSIQNMLKEKGLTLKDYKRVEVGGA